MQEKPEQATTDATPATEIPVDPKDTDSTRIQTGPPPKMKIPRRILRAHKRAIMKKLFPKIKF